ncbi:MAG TPA: hypothetical protein VLJ84_14110, partial [Usitatibacter sp.]|nr:hypothetical protein [Usitatibacter sp.]
MRPIPSAFIASILLILPAEAFAYGEIDPTYYSTIPGWRCEQEVARLPNDNVLVGLSRFSTAGGQSAVGKVRSDGTLDPAW